MLRFIAKSIFKLNDWKLEGDVPPKPHKFILAFGPHSSDVDVPLGLGAAATGGIRIKLLVNKREFKHLQGPLLRACGAIPVDKEMKGGITATHGQI